MYRQLNQFSVRKSKAQKAAFRIWLTEEMTRCGYRVREEHNGSSVNWIAGEPETAELIVATHYDTPAKRLWPDWHFPRNPLAFMAYQALQALWMAAISLMIMLATALISGSGRLGLWMFVIAFGGQIALLLSGPASRKQHGSGLNFLLEAMANLPEEDRQRVAFILWDNGCKGMAGSRAWAKAHPRQAYTTPVLNVDALSPDGDWLLLPSRLARTIPVYAEVEEALRKCWGNNLKCFVKRVRISDESAFRCGIALTRCRQMPLIGYWTREKG